VWHILQNPAYQGRAAYGKTHMMPRGKKARPRAARGRPAEPRRSNALDGLSGKLNERQQKALQGMFREGPEGFKGGLSAGKYSTITGASPATTTRDLADLTEKGALIREGERRHARYKLSIPLRPVPHISVSERGELVEE
jgi:DNA-binding transcriptional ArsR family regulator